MKAFVLLHSYVESVWLLEPTVLDSLKLIPLIQIVTRHNFLVYKAEIRPKLALFLQPGSFSNKMHPDTNDNTRSQQQGYVSFKQKKPLATRKEEVASIRTKFPNKIPVIVERYHKETSLPALDKTKFLVPQEITMSQLITIIRNRLQLNSQQALYLLVSNRNLASLSRPLTQVYRDYRDEDGFLYVTYASQEVFGWKVSSY